MLPLPLPPVAGLTPPQGPIQAPDLGKAFEQALSAARTTQTADPMELVPPAASLEVPQEKAEGRNPVERLTATLGAGPHAGRSASHIEAPDALFAPLKGFLGEVNTQFQHANTMQEQLASGQDVDLHDVMIATEKASIGLQLTTQIRNKLLDAYQEVMRMQV